MDVMNPILPESWPLIRYHLVVSLLSFPWFSTSFTSSIPYPEEFIFEGRQWLSYLRVFVLADE